MGRDEKHGGESAPVDFPEPVTVAWDTRGVFNDPELASWGWDLVRKALRLDDRAEEAPASPAAEPAER